MAEESRMTEVDIVGAAMTRFGKFPDRNIRSLAEEAVGAALIDAGLTAADVGMVFFSNAVAGILTGQEMIRGQVALRHTGLLGKPIVNVENACASASTAFHLAVAAVASGMVDVALAVGAEKLTHEDKARSFAAIGTAVDLSQMEELRRWTANAAAGSDRGTAGSPTSPPRDTEGNGADGKRSFFMDVYAANTRGYMRRTGATVEDFAEVAVKSHQHAALNPNAQYRTPVTV
jgi:acetyl-CoA acyltransferase